MSRLTGPGASAEQTDVPNAALWPFDVAIPGSQPLFQPEVLIPAGRAALALNCQIQPCSKFDRKHYFYHDQPAGYQITQYYEPLAKNGNIVLHEQDGLSKTDGPELTVRIQQIQLEQDTARTQEQNDGTNLIDFNRSGHPLIEIISLPDMHSPEAAGAYVRKIQSILFAIDAVTTGMEMGGLRADVNVSVRRRDAGVLDPRHPFKGLGQRTEIKNLSSFKSVEDAVRAERDRQIDLLESGGVVQAETRGWSLSSPSITRRLRGKEGEVDYRYMPDPDISPVYIDPEVVNYLRSTLPPVPSKIQSMLINEYGLTSEDASTLYALDGGMRLLWYQEIAEQVKEQTEQSLSTIGPSLGNWVLHELGALLTTYDVQWHQELVRSRDMATLIRSLQHGSITGTSAKHLLKLLFDGDTRSAETIIKDEGLTFVPMTAEEYTRLAEEVISSNPDEAEAVRTGDKRALGKLKFLLGKMMQKADRSRIEAQSAEATLRQLLTK